jgi:hypothetical protein
LTDTLDELIGQRYLSQDEGLQILERFDKVGIFADLAEEKRSWAPVLELRASCSFPNPMNRP